MAEAAWINADAGVPEYNASELRRIQVMHLWPGSSDRFGAREGVRPNGQNTVDVSGTTWIQRDLTGTVYPGLTSDSGPYVVEKQEEDGSFDPADGSNDRIDALDLLVEDDDEDASGNRQVTTVYVAGTPAVTPGEPPLTTNAFRIGTFLVPAGGTPSPTVRTQAQWTVAVGGIVPLADGETPPSTGVYEGAYADQQEALIRRTGAAWVPVASPNSPTVLVFTTSGPFNKADFPWARKVKVRVQGGGGGGGGTAATSAGEAASGSGGGGGGYAESTIDISALASSVTATIGDGGSGGSPGNNNGSAGGDSSFGSHVTGGGGEGGQGGTNTGGLNVTDGGDGGTGSINTGVGFIRPGGAGHNGSNDQGTVMNLGHGGEAMIGPGGRPSGTNVGGAGTPGGARGGGGSGAFANPGQANFGGGDGFAGSVILEIY